MTLLNTTKSYRALDRIMAIVLKIVTFLVVVSILTAVAISATSCSKVELRPDGSRHALVIDESSIEESYDDIIDHVPITAPIDLDGVAWRKTPEQLAELKRLRKAVSDKAQELYYSNYEDLYDKLEEQYRYHKLLYITPVFEAKWNELNDYKHGVRTIDCQWKRRYRQARRIYRDMAGNKLFTNSGYTHDKGDPPSYLLTNNTDHTHVSPREYSTYRLWEHKEYTLKLKALDYIEQYGETNDYEDREWDINDMKRTIDANHEAIKKLLKELKPKIDNLQCSSRKKKKKK